MLTDDLKIWIKVIADRVKARSQCATMNYGTNYVPVGEISDEI